MESVAKLAELAVFLAVVVGPLLAWLLLLNLRDRRAERVLAAVVPHVTSRDLNGRVAMELRGGVLSPRSVLRVSFWALSEDEFWAFATKLARHVPSHVRVVLEGTIGGLRHERDHSGAVDVADRPERGVRAFHRVRLDAHQARRAA